MYKRQQQPSLFDFLAEQVRLYASVYRPYVARLHAISMHTLFAPLARVSTARGAAVDPFVAASATHLLSALHLTGAAGDSTSASKVTQGQLWAATANEMLDAAVAAVCGCAPSRPWREHGLDATAVPSNALAWEPPSADYAESIPGCLARVEHLIGGASPGVLTLYLMTATPRPVPVPVGRCLLLAHAMIEARKTYQAPVDQQRVETTALPTLRLAGLKFFVQTVLAFQQTCWRFLGGSDDALGSVCTMAEHASGLERLAALRALEVLLNTSVLLTDNGVVAGGALPLSPTGPAVQRIARLCAQQMGSFLVHEPRAWQLPMKRARAFESDEVVMAGRAAQDAVLAKPAVDVEMTAAAATVYAALFRTLACSAAPGSRDLARVGTLALAGLAEAMVDARLVDATRAPLLRLCTASVRALTDVVVANGGALVAHVLPRVHALLVRGTHASVPLVRATCDEALMHVLAVVRPRAPPLVDLVDSSALEERVEDAADADHVPLPLPGWRGANSTAADYAVLSSVVPLEETCENEDASSAEARPEALPQAHAPALHAAAPEVGRSEAQPSAATPAQPEALPSAPVSTRCTEAPSAPAASADTAPDVPDDLSEGSDIPQLDMASDDD